jgi:hypothetical protein
MGLADSLRFLCSNKLLDPLVRQPEQLTSVSPAEPHPRQGLHCLLESLCRRSAFVIGSLPRGQSPGQRAAGPLRQADVLDEISRVSVLYE